MDEPDGLDIQQIPATIDGDRVMMPSFQITSSEEERPPKPETAVLNLSELAGLAMTGRKAVVKFKPAWKIG